MRVTLSAALLALATNYNRVEGLPLVGAERSPRVLVRLERRF